MELKPYQVCRSTEGWAAVRVESSTTDLIYTVLVSPWGLTQENICECPGYTYRGICKHQKVASDTLCRWSELTCLATVQTEGERKNKLCPSCGGPTKWEVEVIE